MTSKNKAQLALLNPHQQKIVFVLQRLNKDLQLPPTQLLSPPL